MSNHADPNVVKKIENQIEKEAKAEEKNVQHVWKDLKGTEKADAKASKVDLHYNIISCNMLTIFPGD
jgi:hypothetical protein